MSYRKSPSERLATAWDTILELTPSVSEAYVRYQERRHADLDNMIHSTPEYAPQIYLSVALEQGLDAAY